MGYIETLRQRPDMVSPGVSACQGCGGELVLRRVLQIAGPDTIVCVPPGCMAGSGAIGWSHDTGMKVPVHIPLLDNTASFLSGLSHIYERRGRGEVNIVAVAGDGATADCGFQSLSGAAERGEKMLYVCYDNEGYMNTGYQRSSTTTEGSRTSTTPLAALYPESSKRRNMSRSSWPCTASNTVPRRRPGICAIWWKKSKRALPPRSAALCISMSLPLARQAGASHPTRP